MQSAPKHEFKFLTMQECRLRYINELKAALEKKYGSEDNFPEHRKVHSKKFKDTLDTLIDEYKYLVPEAEKKLVYLGLNRVIKREIESTYRFLSADRSVLHRGLDHAVGITDKNPLDEKTEKEAIKAWNFFAARLKNSAYNNIFKSKEFEIFKDVLDDLDVGVDLKILPENEKGKEKPALEKEKLETGRQTKLGWFTYSKNKQISDKTDLETYGLQRSHLFFIIPKPAPVEKPKPHAKKEENGEEFLNKITLGMKR